ncbi:MAG: hypothetical protein M3032_12375 [Verrucomicrobiota bacterium]|nr:hypothetical protein [Verrucomicrobiota bacterium]
MLVAAGRNSSGASFASAELYDRTNALRTAHTTKDILGRASAKITPSRATRHVRAGGEQGLPPLHFQFHQLHLRAAACARQLGRAPA